MISQVDSPAGDAERLREPHDRHRALPEVSNRGRGDVGTPVIPDVFVNLIADNQEVSLVGDPRDDLQFLLAEHFTAGVRRSAHHHRPRVRVERGP